MQQELRILIRRAENALLRQDKPEREVRRDLETLLRDLIQYERKEDGRNGELQRRLEEAEQTIDAIRKGEVDAIVRSDESGSRVYTLEGPDRPYQNIVETMNAGAVTIDSNGTILYSNGVFSDMTRIPLEGLIGSSFSELIFPEDAPLFVAFIKKTRGREKTTEEVRLKGLENLIFVRLAGSSQTTDQMERVSLVIADISDLKAAQDSLQQAVESIEYERDRLMTLLNSMNEGVWFIQTDGRVGMINSVARSQAVDVGLDLKKVFDSPIEALLSQLGLLTPDLEPFDSANLMQLFNGKSFSGLEIAFRNLKNDELFHARISSNPILDKDKKVEGNVVVIQDITAERQAEKERARLEEHLHQAQKMEAIGALAGGIAHDFNNMLAVVLGNAELALDEMDQRDGAQRNIEQIIKASKRARDLVKQILTFSRKTERKRTPLKLAPLVRETYGLLRGTLPSTIKMELQIETESAAIVADPSQMQQVIMNLATNAAYAMRGRGGTLTIGMTGVSFEEGSSLPDRDMAVGNYVKLTVRDSGTGMTEKVRQRIFEPFFTDKQPGQGTGMGLPVVYGIVNSHGGAITVESRPGKGSTFSIFLPSTGAEAQDERREKEAIPGGTERILVIDDEPYVVEMTSAVLKRLGYAVTASESPVEALKLFLNEPRNFDLVITDQVMPDLSGLEVARKMLTKRGDIPIILFTGYSETVSPETARSAGIREFVMKPITKREVANTVRRVLDAAGGPAS